MRPGNAQDEIRICAPSGRRHGTGALRVAEPRALQDFRPSLVVTMIAVPARDLTVNEAGWKRLNTLT